MTAPRTDAALAERLLGALRSGADLDRVIAELRAPAISTLLDQLAATPIFDRGLVELLHAVDDFAPKRPRRETALARLGALLAAPKVRSLIAPFAEALAADPGAALRRTDPVAELWERIRGAATRRTDLLAPLFRDADVEPMDAPPGWSRLRDTARERRRLQSRTTEESLALETLFGLYAAECAAGEPADRHGHRNRLLRHLLAIDPVFARERWQREFDAADAAFDLPRCEDLIDVLAGGVAERERRRTAGTPALRALRAFTGGAEDHDLIARARARLDARLVTADAWYRTTRYFARPTYHARVEALLGEDGQRNADPESDRWLLHLHAPGGSGKTMLLRWLIARRCAPAGIPVATIDFDAFALPPDTWEIVLRVAERLDLQIPGRPLASRLSSYGDALRTLALPLESSVDASLLAGASSRRRLQEERRERQARRRELNERVPRDVADALRDVFGAAPRASRTRGGAAGAPGHPHRLVVVIDTLEQALYTHRTDLPPLLEAMRMLHDAVPALRVVLAGRYDLRERAPTLAAMLTEAGETVQIDPFTREESRRYLALRGLDPASGLVEPIIARCSGNPLKLALYADLVHSTPELTREDIESRADIDLIYLVERIIARIRPELRWIVRYGVVPRRLTLDFVRSVLLPLLGAALRGNVEWDDPEMDLAELPPSLRRTDLFTRQGVTVDEATIEELWSALREFAAASSWVIPVPGDPNALEFHSSVLEPMRRMLRRHGVFGMLHAAAAERARARAEATPDRRRECLATELHHHLNAQSSARHEERRRVPELALEGWRTRRAEASAREDHELRLALAEEVVRFAEEERSSVPASVLIEAHLEEADAAAFLIGEAGPSDSVVRRLVQSVEAIERAAGADPQGDAGVLAEALRRFPREPAAILAHVRGEAARLDERDEDALRSFRYALSLTDDPARQALLLDRIDAIETREIDAREESGEASTATLSADRQIDAYQRVVAELVATGRVARGNDGRLIVPADAPRLWSRLGRIGKRLQRLGRQGEFVSTFLPSLAPSQRGGDETRARSILGRGLFAAGLPGTALDTALGMTSSAARDPVRPGSGMKVPVEQVGNLERKATAERRRATDEAYELARVACRAAVAAGDPQRAVAMLDAATREGPESEDQPFTGGEDAQRGPGWSRAWSRGRRAAEVERGRALVALMEPAALDVLALVGDQARDFGESRTEAEASCCLAAQQFFVEGSPRRAETTLRRAAGLLPAPSDQVWVEYHALHALLLLRQGRPNVALNALDAPLQILHLHRGPSHHAARLAVVGLLAAQEMEASVTLHTGGETGDAIWGPQRRSTPAALSSKGAPAAGPRAPHRPSSWTDSIEVLGTRLIEELERMDAPTARAGTLEWLSMLAPIAMPEAIRDRLAAAVPDDGVGLIRLPHADAKARRARSAPIDDALYALRATDLHRVCGMPLPAAAMLARAWVSAGSLPLLLARVLECATRLTEHVDASGAGSVEALMIDPDDARTRVERLLARSDAAPVLSCRLLLSLGEFEAARGATDAAGQTLRRLLERAPIGSGVLPPTLERRRLLLEAVVNGRVEPARSAAEMALADDDVVEGRRIEAWWRGRAPAGSGGSDLGDATDALDGAGAASRRRGRGGSRTAASERRGAPEARPDSVKSGSVEAGSMESSSTESQSESSEPSALARLRTALRIANPLRVSLALGGGRTSLEVAAHSTGDEARASHPIGSLPSWLVKSVPATSGAVVDPTLSAALSSDSPAIRASLAALLVPPSSTVSSLVTEVASRERARVGSEVGARAARGLRLEVTEPALLAMPWEWALAPVLRGAGVRDEDALLFEAYRGIERVAADRESISWLQSAINLLGEKLMVDGTLGPQTVAAIDAILAKKAEPAPDLVESFLERLRERLGPPTIAVVAPHGVDAGAMFVRHGLTVERVLPAPARELASLIARLAPQVVVFSGGFSSDATSGRMEFDLQPAWSMRALRNTSSTLPRMEPSDLDHVVAALPRGRRPLLVLEALTPSSPVEALRQILDRNAFAGMVFRFGSAPAVVVTGGMALERSSEWSLSDDALAPALARGASVGEMIATVRRASIPALGMADSLLGGDAALFESILYAHDPRWRPAVGRSKA